MKRASENVVEKGKKFKPLEVGQDLGIILSVTLQNFMCHDHLKFDFDPHVNFIIGQNGSGKSAILTGIILALGGKSSVTGRYSNIKGFVKTGKNKARVSVTLKNCGPYAYKPEIYGDKILVEREISSESISSYKLKNGEGKIVSTLKEELTNVLIAMDIQIDNPVLVLTQETSRNFLMAKTGKEEKLYEFFFRGTGLQKLQDDYQLSVSTNEDCKHDLEAKKQALNTMEAEVKKLDKLRESDEKLDELKRESFWGRVILMEKELETLQEAKRKVLNGIETSKNEAEKSKNIHDEITIKLEKFKQERAEIEKKIVTERSSLSELGLQSDEHAGKVRTCKGQVELYKREEKKSLDDIRIIEAAINEHQMKDQTDYENEKNQRNAEIHELEERLSNVELQKTEFEKKQYYLLEQKSSKKQELFRLKAEIGDLNSKRSIQHKKYAQMVNSKKNRQYMFGEHTPAVLKEIQQNRRNFRKMPKGPIGLDIEVKDTRWTSAVEACIKPHMLRSFCVDNPDDSMLMTQILQKFYTDRMPPVIVSPFLPHVHNVSQHKAQTNFPTVLDMLTIKDPVIANCLIDQLSIENIILIEDITTAQNIMLDRPPAKCYSAFLLNCDEILLNPYRYYSASRRLTNVLSHTVDESDLVKIQEEINTHDADIRIKENEITALLSEIKEYPAALDDLKNKIVHLTTLKSGMQSRIEELKQSEEEPRNVPEMHDEYMSLKAELETKQKELREAQEKLDMHSTKCNELRERLNQQRALVTTINQKFETLGSNINSYVKKKEYLASSIKEFEKEKKEKEGELKKLETEIKQADEAIKKTIAERKKVDKKPRIPTMRSHEEIDAQIEEIEKLISKASDTTDKASLYDKFIEKSKRLREAKNEYNQIDKYNKQIEKMMAKRERRINEIIDYTQLVLNFSFNVFLKANGFKGSLIFKHRTLKLEATPHKEKAESAGKKACSSLSGGERSFVTIAFLIALWDKIRMPFRILDEYDVFMDSNNRHLSINLLLKRATIMKGTQFIFLSPLDLPNLVGSNTSIKVHKMQAPQRIGLNNMEE